jgi:2-methylcitrate dehydratase PrpD
MRTYQKWRIWVILKTDENPRDNGNFQVETVDTNVRDEARDDIESGNDKFPEENDPAVENERMLQQKGGTNLSAVEWVEDVFLSNRGVVRQFPNFGYR